jgi:Domain of unknown function (DUF4214)/Methyltransferase domain
MLKNLKQKLRSRLPFFKLSDRDFLDLSYREIMGREIDTDGLTLYTRLLQEGRTRWEVILMLIRSEEFAAKKAREQTALDSDQAYLEKVYRFFYDREIDAEGRQFYLQLLRQGTDRISVLSYMVNSQDFISRILRQHTPLPDIRLQKSGHYHTAEDFIRKRKAPVFRIEKNTDYDWLERMIRQNGYYERPGVWGFDLDLDKQVMAAVMSCFSPGRALEIGCSGGAVLKGLWLMGIEAEGVEISAMAKARAFPEIRNRIHLGDLLQVELPAEYELIFGLDIFEHFNPNRLPVYVGKIRELLRPGGYVYANIPAFGEDPSFGNPFPIYLEAWEGERAAGGPFQTLPVDEGGYPLDGHLTWADTLWWSRQFTDNGFARELEIERALHQKLDALLEARAPARKAFYVFSKEKKAAKNQEIIEAVRRVVLPGPGDCT